MKLSQFEGSIVDKLKAIVTGLLLAIHYQKSSAKTKPWLTYLDFWIQQAVFSEVCNTTQKVEGPIPHGDHRIFGENYSLSSMPGNRELGKDDACKGQARF